MAQAKKLSKTAQRCLCAADLNRKKRLSSRKSTATVPRSWKSVLTTKAWKMFGAAWSYWQRFVCCSLKIISYIEESVLRWKTSKVTSFGCHAAHPNRSRKTTRENGPAANKRGRAGETAYCKSGLQRASPWNISNIVKCRPDCYVSKHPELRQVKQFKVTWWLRYFFSNKLSIIKKCFYTHRVIQALSISDTTSKT